MMQTYNQQLITKTKYNFAFKDLILIAIILGIFIVVVKGVSQMRLPIGVIENLVISTSPTDLPQYAMRTTLRMFCAMIFTLIFAIGYGVIAAKNQTAEKILIPLLDVFQSVPVLGYLSFTVTAFLALFPGSSMGLECAAIFAVFTNQVPNVTFSFYQSLKTIPEDLHETCAVFRVSSFKRFFILEFPFAIPGLIWNGMMSMSGSWFLLVATETITVKQNVVMLPGVGSYIAQAINQRNLPAMGYAILCMLLVIFLYDFLFFRPLLAWSYKFHPAVNENTPITKSFIFDLLCHSKISKIFIKFLKQTAKLANNVTSFLFIYMHCYFSISNHLLKLYDNITLLTKFKSLWQVLFLVCIIYGVSLSLIHIHSTISWVEFFTVIKLGFYTLLRVVVMITLSALVWVPIGVYIGLRPELAKKIEPIAQFLAAFPANLVFPLAVILIIRYHLNANIWLSPLMILGTQWYILFNVIAGTNAFSVDLLHASNMLHIKGKLWWQKVILPGILPYIVTGGITAAGGAWNASIIAEVVSWGHYHIAAQGLGAYITQATLSSDLPRVAIGIGIMSLYVITLNNLVWRPLYNFAAEKAKLE